MFTEANLFPEAASMIHGGRVIGDHEKNELKALFIEGIVRFLDIYAQTEIGEGIETDIKKIALFINSPSFENDDLYALKDIGDVYALCEELALAGLPLWRFLKLSEYQSNVFESGYEERRFAMREEASKKRPCFGCIWYKNSETFLGMLEECTKPNTERETFKRERNSFSAEKTRTCKWATTLDEIPPAVLNLPERNLSDRRRKRDFLNAIEPARARYKKELERDTFRIPKNLTDEETVEMGAKYEPLSDLALAFSNKRGKMERQDELRRAVLVEEMVKFFEQYAKCELGSNYVANIKNIALYVTEMEREVLHSIKNESDVYDMLESIAINDGNVGNFVKIDSDYCENDRTQEEF